MATCESSDEEGGCLKTSSYFVGLVKKLCLRDFPHGYGRWRLSPGDISADVRHARDELRDSYEDVNELTDLIRDGHSPWSCSGSWSEDICSLKEIAVKHPEVLRRGNFIWKHFSNLKFVDKKIVEIDADVVNLVNLDRLVLSVNRIQTLEPNHLPKCLRYLELQGNRISDISASDTPVTLLFYLGLGQNHLSELKKHFSPRLWPCLAILDLSLNNLSDLHALCSQLKELCSLRSLNLFGNPLSYLPIYRLYTIDTVEQLTHLDESVINVLERRTAAGLKCKDSADRDLHEGKIMIEILEVNGLPDLTNESNDSPRKKCFLRYSFADGCPNSFCPGNVRSSDQDGEVAFQPGDAYTTHSYDWKNNIEINESTVVSFSDLIVLKKSFFGNLRVEVFEASIFPSESKPEQEKKKTFKGIVSKKSQSEESAKEETRPEAETMTRLLRIFSLPLCELLTGSSELNLQFNKKLILETILTLKPLQENLPDQQKIKTKTGKTQKVVSEVETPRLVSTDLEVKVRVAIVRYC